MYQAHRREIVKNFLLFLVFILCSFNVRVHAQTSCPNVFLFKQPPISKWPVKTICFQHYAAAFSDRTLGNIYSAEWMTKDQIVAGRDMKRYGYFDNHDPIIQDYRGSGYDRGHMTPSGDMPDYQSQVETFISSNIVPQVRELNSGKWNWIEHNVRKMAVTYHQLFVVTGPYFQEPVVKIGRDGVWVPYAVWKAVYIPSLNRAGVYFCKNKIQPTCYRMSVAFFIHKTGIDPFPALSMDIKEIKFLLPKPARPKNNS